MTRILVVEDNVDFYCDYLLRLFQNLLPMEKLEFVHAATIEEAVLNLPLAWDVILMDFAMPGTFRVPPDNPEGLLIKDGADMVRLRRQFEKSDGLKPSFVMGTSSSGIGNRLMVEAGADVAHLKLEVPQMATEIKKKLV